MNPDEEDDRTVVRPPGAGGSTVRMTQGAARGDIPPTASAATTQHSHTLPNGTRLGEFELTQTLGEGGFGIVYLAWDHSLDRKVALKEYMPSAIAFRVGETEIRPRSERHQETFEAGMKSFINEAKLLAQFDHPALVKVYRFWEANGTAYMVMPFYEGVTVRDAVRKFAEPPDEAWILSLLEPLFHALTMLHGSQCFHRDIAPDNIMLLAPNDRPLLLDFGAARRVIGDMTQALTAILKPGYAPVEQYAEVPGLKQGPWTDVYALAAVVHWIITGKTPPASVGRMFGDSYVPLVERAAGRYSPHFLAAIDRALVVLPDKRTASIDALRHDMTSPGGALPGTMPVGAAPAPAPTAAPPVRVDSPLPRTDGPRTSSTGNTAWPATVEATRAAASMPRSEPAATLEEVTLPPRATDSSARARVGGDGTRRWPLFAAVGGVLVAAAVAAVLWSTRTSVPTVAQPITPPNVAQPPLAPPVQDTGGGRAAGRAAGAGRQATSD
jgi:serine/threonine protein kinase